MDYIVFKEMDKGANHILLMQVREYFLKAKKGKIRSQLIIPEPFFVHIHSAMKLRFTQRLPSKRTNHGFMAIRNLRSLGQQ